MSTNKKLFIKNFQPKVNNYNKFLVRKKDIKKSRTLLSSKKIKPNNNKLLLNNKLSNKTGKYYNINLGNNFDENINTKNIPQKSPKQNPKSSINIPQRSPKKSPRVYKNITKKNSKKIPPKSPPIKSILKKTKSYNKNVKIRTNIKYYERKTFSDSLDFDSKKNALTNLGVTKSLNVPKKLVNDLYFLLHN